MTDTLQLATPRASRLPIMALCALLALACMASRARADDTGRVQARKDFQHDLVTLLALRSEARPLLGAALLARTRPDEGGPLGFHRLIGRAAKSADAGPAVNWVRLSDCDADAGNCPNAAAMKALERLAPDNAAVWLLRLGQAARDGDARAATDALHRAAQAARYDDYTGRSLQALADAVTLLPPPPATLAGKGSHASQVAALQVTMVFGIGGAQPMPGFHLVAAQCLPNVAASDPHRRQLCLQLADVLVWGSSPLARSLGLHLRSTLSRDAGVRRQADAYMRDLAWQVQQFGLLQARARNDVTVAHRLLMLARQGGTEMSLMQAALRAFSIPDEVPEGNARLSDMSASAAHPPHP